MKKILKTIFVGLIIFIIIYSSSTFFLRDKNELMCLLSFGTYETVIRCKDDAWNTKLCEDRTEDFYCVGGIYDPRIWGSLRCPDEWHRDESLFLGSTGKEVFIWDDKRVNTDDVGREEYEWITSNCDLKKSIGS